MPTPFKPSDVDLLGSFPPLCATMGHTEAELAAAILVHACRVRGDEWKPHTLPELGEVLGEALDAGVEPFASMNGNPFCKPDLRDLADRGFAVWSEGHLAIALTEAGIERLRRWVKP
jgi:hypothetical protein